MSATNSRNHAENVTRQVIETVAAVTRELHAGQERAVTLDSLFERDLGLDSLARVELIQRLDTAFHVQLPDLALSHAETPRDLLRWLALSAPPESPLPEVKLGSASEVGSPAHAATLTEMLAWHVARQPLRTHVLLYGDAHLPHAISYQQLYDGAAVVAAGLFRFGVQPGQAVAVMLPTGADYLECFFGILFAGCVPVPIYPPARLSQLRDHLQRHAGILSNAQAAALITEAAAKPVAMMLCASVPSLRRSLTPQDLRGNGSEQPWPARADDCAFIQYTSGSTGDPKGVVLSHANLLANVRAMGQAIRISPDDVVVSWLPLYHDMGLIGAWFGALYFGCPLVLMSPLAFLSRPARWLEAISRHRGTISGAPNFACSLCARKIDDAARAGLDLSTWRFAFDGAETVSAKTLEDFAARFAPQGFHREALAPVYGLAEAAVGLCFPPPGRGPRIDVIDASHLALLGIAEPTAANAAALRIPSCGRPLDGYRVRIVGSNGSALPDRHVGRLEFCGPSATAGYFRNINATAQLVHAGWLDSGDMAYIADSEVFIAGRVKEMIIRGGRNLYPYELEEAVGSMPGVRKGCVAAFGSQDHAHDTERLVVLAETNLKDEGACDELRERIRACSVEILGIPADDVRLLPPHGVLKTSSGKIRRQACRALYERGDWKGLQQGNALSNMGLAAQAAAARGWIALRRASELMHGACAWLSVLLLAPPICWRILCAGNPLEARSIARKGARILLRLNGIQLETKGLDQLPDGPHVLALNHASYLDALVLTAALPLAGNHVFAAKHEPASHKVLGPVLRALGTLFIERFDMRSSTHGVEAMEAALRDGNSVIAFPEGTFTPNAGLGRFHLGPFMAAAQAGVPVVAAGLRNTRRLLRDETWLPKAGTVGIEVVQTWQPHGADWACAIALRENCRAAVLKVCGEYDAAY